MGLITGMDRPIPLLPAGEGDVLQLEKYFFVLSPSVSPFRAFLRSATLASFVLCQNLLRIKPKEANWREAIVCRGASHALCLFTQFGSEDGGKELQKQEICIQNVVSEGARFLSSER